MTQAQVATLVGLHRETYAQIERGEYVTSADRFARIYAVVGIDGEDVG